jgi:hypothetical protein
MEGFGSCVVLLSRGATGRRIPCPRSELNERIAVYSLAELIAKVIAHKYNRS